MFICACVGEVPIMGFSSCSTFYFLLFTFYFLQEGNPPSLLGMQEGWLDRGFGNRQGANTNPLRQRGMLTNENVHGASVQCCKSRSSVSPFRFSLGLFLCGLSCDSVLRGVHCCLLISGRQECLPHVHCESS